MGGFHIATIRGIPVRIHITFVLVLPFLAFAFARAFSAAAEVAGVPPERLAGSPYLWGLGVAIALFASVLLHELGHALYAVRKGGRVRSITLLMIGGVSEISEPPRETRHEAVMALLGPLVSLTLGGLFFLANAAAITASFNLRFLLFYVGSLNVFLGLFNLLPAFPMDGGRILRSLLTKRFGEVRATSIAARVGKGFAIAFGIWGALSFNLLLLLIAFFVFMGAEAETRGVVVKALLGRLRARDVMHERLLSVPADTSADEVAARMRSERTLAFALSDGGAPAVVTLEAIRGVPAERRAEVAVRELRLDVPALAADDEATTALRTLGENTYPLIPVMDRGVLVGTIAREDIARALELSELEAIGDLPERFRPRRATGSLIATLLLGSMAPLGLQGCQSEDVGLARGADDEAEVIVPASIRGPAFPPASLEPPGQDAAPSVLVSGAAFASELVVPGRPLVLHVERTGATARAVGPGEGERVWFGLASDVEGALAEPGEVYRLSVEPAERSAGTSGSRPTLTTVRLRLPVENPDAHHLAVGDIGASGDIVWRVEAPVEVGAAFATFDLLHAGDAYLYLTKR